MAGSVNKVILVGNLGRDPEIRPGLKSGHIPGSINLPYTDL
ncbi:MAG: single-stranded DNA-binding protein, partial [Burkholderiaceae bacterium]|nr:single-stranded DNA-binding protein [Burkholderiaceae bacterium]